MSSEADTNASEYRYYTFVRLVGSIVSFTEYLPSACTRINNRSDLTISCLFALLVLPANYSRKCCSHFFETLRTSLRVPWMVV